MLRHYDGQRALAHLYLSALLRTLPPHNHLGDPSPVPDLSVNSHLFHPLDSLLLSLLFLWSPIRRSLSLSYVLRRRRRRRRRSPFPTLR